MINKDDLNFTEDEAKMRQGFMKLFSVVCAIVILIVGLSLYITTKNG